MDADDDRMSFSELIDSSLPPSQQLWSGAALPTGMTGIKPPLSALVEL